MNVKITYLRKYKLLGELNFIIECSTRVQLKSLICSTLWNAFMLNAASRWGRRARRNFRRETENCIYEPFYVRVKLCVCIPVCLCAVNFPHSYFSDDAEFLERRWNSPKLKNQERSSSKINAALKILGGVWAYIAATAKTNSCSCFFLVPS